MRFVTFGIFSVAAALAGCDDPQFGSTEQQAVVSPLTFDFGTVSVGSTSASTGYNVGPGGYTDDYVIAVTSSCADFQVNAPGLPANVYKYCLGGGEVPLAHRAPCSEIEIQNYSFSVAFRPSVAGTQSCTITVDMETSADRTATVTGTGMPLPREFTLVQPASGSFNFGDVPVSATSGTATFMARNDGAEALTIDPVAITSGPFTLVSGAGVSLLPGGTVSWGVTCTPPAAGPHTGTFAMTTNDPDETNVAVQLACNGITSNLVLNPSPLAFPAVRLGESSPVTTVSLSNSGGVALMVESVTVDNPAFTIVTPIAPQQVGPSLGFPVDLTFTPTVEGDAAGTLTVAYDGGQVRTMSLAGSGRTVGFSISPTGTLDFGPICLGQSDDEIFVILNTGSADYMVNAITVDDTANFATTLITPATLPAPIAAAGGGVANFRLSAAPVAIGELSAQVTVATDVPGAPDQIVALRAVGLPAGVNATPASAALGDAPVGQVSELGTVIVSNCDVAPAVITAATITGVDAADFALVLQPPDGTIAGNGSAEYLVQMLPTSAGPKVAALELTHANGTVVVPLSGDGFVSQTVVDRGSYYACATSGGDRTSWWLIGLGVVLALRRRRRA